MRANTFNTGDVLSSAKMNANFAGRRGTGAAVKRSWWYECGMTRSFKDSGKGSERAQKALGVTIDAEVMRFSSEQVAEMAEFWRFMKKSRGKLRPGSFNSI